MIGKREVVFKAATFASRRSDRDRVVKNQIHCTPPSVQPTYLGRWTGMLKANMAAADALTFLRFIGVAA
jgi:hypothetical protein